MRTNTAFCRCANKPPKFRSLTQKVKFPPLSDTLYSELIIVWGFFVPRKSHERPVEIKDSDLPRITKWASQGMTNDQVADLLGISRSKFYSLKAKGPNIRDALKKGRASGIETVSNALFDKATEGDTTAQIFFLKTRQPEVWNERVKANTRRYDIPELDNGLHNTIVQAVASYTPFGDTLMLLNMEQYEFQKIIDQDDFRPMLQSLLGQMLFDINSNIPDTAEENPKADIISGWLKAINEGASYSTTTMMYINVLRGADDYTYDDQFWESSEGIQVTNSLREHIRENRDYITFLHLYFKRVVKKDLVEMPFMHVLAKFYLEVIDSGRKRFILNMPVRHGKTELLNGLIFFLFLCHPEAEVMHSSYGDAVLQTMRNRINTGLNNDPFFRSLMDIEPASGPRFNLSDFGTNHGGNYFAVTINGQATGRGGAAMNPDQKGLLAFDDPSAPKWKGTQHMRNANETYTNVFLSRAPHLPVLVVQQRVGHDDLSQYILDESNEKNSDDPKYRYLVCYVPFDKNETTDGHYEDLKRRYPNVDFYGYDEMPYGPINPSMAHYSKKDSCPEAWHIYLTQYQQIPTEPDSKMFNDGMLKRAPKGNLVVDSRTGSLCWAPDGDLKSAFELRILVHVDNSALDEKTVGSDSNAMSVYGLGNCNGVKVGVLFEQYQKPDIGIEEFMRDFESVINRWMSVFNRNPYMLAIEEKMAGAAVRTLAERVVDRLSRQCDVSEVVSLELKRNSGESKLARGKEASNITTIIPWFYWYPYDINKAIITRFADHGDDLGKKPNHWYHQFRYEMVEFTGHEGGSVKDDCCEGFFDVANKALTDCAPWAGYAATNITPLTEHNIVK